MLLRLRFDWRALRVSAGVSYRLGLLQIAVREKRLTRLKLWRQARFNLVVGGRELLECRPEDARRR